MELVNKPHETSETCIRLGCHKLK